MHESMLSVCCCLRVYLLQIASEVKSWDPACSDQNLAAVAARLPHSAQLSALEVNLLVANKPKISTLTSSTCQFNRFSQFPQPHVLMPPCGINSPEVGVTYPYAVAAYLTVLDTESAAYR